MRLLLIGAAMLAAIQSQPAAAADETGPREPSGKPKNPAIVATPVDASTRTLRVAAIQFRSSRDAKVNLQRAVKQLEQCSRQGARVAVFPECALTGYFDSDFMKKFSAEDLATIEREMAAACQVNKIYAIVGMPWRDGGKLYNSAVVIDPQGRIVERYYKLHLAEAWPDPGDHLAVFPIDGTLCSVIVCHDERYPELVRLPVLAGARCVFYLSHESDLKKESKIDPYRAQIQARAVENSVFVVQANAPANHDTSGSHGHSRIIAPDGNIMEEATIFDEDVLLATLELKRATGNMARGSLKAGPLAEWWREGLKHVRTVEVGDAIKE
jgi:predicted amidohydrolase